MGAEDVADEAKKQAKKAKKAKAKSKRGPAIAEGKGEKAGGGGGGGGVAAAAAMAAARPSVASLTAAVSRLTRGEEEENEQEKKEGGTGRAMEDGKLPALTLASTEMSPPPFSSSAHNEEEEEDDEEAFQTFLLEDVPLSYQCPIGICLLTDPITAADGRTYQCVELERWIETCRAKQQPLTSPMTKEPMVAMYFPSHFIKAHVGEFIEQRRQEWVARKGKKKGKK